METKDMQHNGQSTLLQHKILTTSLKARGALAPASGVTLAGACSMMTARGLTGLSRRTATWPEVPFMAQQWPM